MSSIINQHRIYVDSRKRLAGTDSNFSYPILLPPSLKYSHVTLIDALIPKSYYLFSNDNSFHLQEGASIVEISVPEGSDTLETFMNRTANLLTINSPHGFTYTLSYPSLNSTILPDTAKITYTCAGTLAPALIFGTTCFEAFGFLQNSTNNFDLGTLTLESTCVLKLQAEDRLLLHCTGISNPSQDNILMSINSSAYVNYSSITYINYACEYTSSLLKSSTPGTMTFQLTDENNVEIDLNGLNMNFTLCFFYKQDVYQLLVNIMRLLFHKSPEQIEEPTEEPTDLIAKE